MTRRMKLEDGSDGFVIPVNQIPQSYWDSYQNLRSMGFFPEGIGKISENELRKYLPVSLADVQNGGFNKNLAYKQEVRNQYFVWIPAKFFEPDENEYGPISL